MWWLPGATTMGAAWEQSVFSPLPLKVNKKLFYKIWCSFILICYISASFLLLYSPGSLFFPFLFPAVHQLSCFLAVPLSTLVQRDLALQMWSIAQWAAVHAPHCPSQQRRPNGPGVAWSPAAVAGSYRSWSWSTALVYSQPKVRALSGNAVAGERRPK